MDRDNGSTMSSFVCLLEQIYEVSEAAKHVVVCHGCFAHLSSSLGKIRLLLRDVLEAARVDSSYLYSILRPLDTEIKNEKELVTICTTKSKFYLLLNCHAYAKCIQVNLSTLASVLLDLATDNVDLTLKLKNQIKLLCRDMQAMQIRVSAEEEDLVKSAELAARSCYVDAKHANELLYKLASMAGISLERSFLRREYDELRREKEMVIGHKHENEVIQLDRIVSLLSSADALGSATEREQQYHEQRRGVDSSFLPPLQTFYCPITQDVMENPVEIESGHTFEMAAIQKWFAEGHRVCPVSKMELQSLSLKPNRLLQQSIEEWKDRNTVIKLAAMAGRLNSGNEELVTEALLELQFLCEEKSVHKYWVAAEGLIPVLVGLLGSSKRELKKKTLATLTTLVADNSDNRVKACDAGALEYAVRSLARDAGEARQAVALLSELCKEESLCKMASKVQGCILLLVTIASSDNTVAATNAKELLNLFSKDDDNVVRMAEVNHLEPLLECLDKGSQGTQILMANTLSRMQLSDQSRARLVQEGVIPSLVRLTSESNFEGKAVALGAFRNLSCLRENGHAMIEGGVMQPLLEVLLTVKSIAVTTREHAAATFANLAMSSGSSGIDNLWGQRDLGQVLLQLMSLLNLTGPNIQSHILRALDFICNSKAALGLRESLRERESIQFLARFMDAKDAEVRLYALKVLLTLTKDGGGDVLAEEMTPDSYKVMVDLFSLESLEEEKAAAMGILGNLPLYNRQVTEQMLQAGVLSSIVSILERCSSRHSARSNTPLVENAVWTLVRFTLPTDIQLQSYAAKHGIIPILVNVLSISTPLIKSRAAMSLQQFSENTPKLSVPIKKSGGWCCFTPPPEVGCSVHRGLCSVEDTFCLVEANAVLPLIQALEDRDDDLDEAALSALVTLVSDDECWEKGSDVIANAEGVRPIIKKLTSENVGVQEKALLVLEKVLRREKYKAKFGNVAQMPLVSLAQGGTALTRPLAARLLAHLNILQEQSSYF